jgi:hypothetical protein
MKYPTADHLPKVFMVWYVLFTFHAPIIVIDNQNRLYLFR